jgi:hypothetical protein
MLVCIPKIGPKRFLDEHHHCTGMILLSNDDARVRCSHAGPGALSGEESPQHRRRCCVDSRDLVLRPSCSLRQPVHETALSEPLAAPACHQKITFGRMGSVMYLIQPFTRIAVNCHVETRNEEVLVNRGIQPRCNDSPLSTILISLQCSQAQNTSELHLCLNVPVLAPPPTPSKRNQSMNLLLEHN